MIPQSSTSQNLQRYHKNVKHRATITRTMYPDVIEDLPPDCPVPLGKSVQINAFVDADLTGELITRRYQTGI